MPINTVIIGIGFQRGTHSRWQFVTNDGSGAPTLTDIGGSSVWVRMVDEVFEQEIEAELPANTQFLSLR
ncbi:MAG: hypothetical protein U1A24_16875 [Cypionkella sp.]|jgi:hypothetical protein|uniref:hypothetical protein n=1 Tax=Cypionkella sp. TaxID=2811411 RepID=UPI002ABB56ED|nr:hypothetical protein [Cypionkella sp.]MDZ4312225.1 hypothetical protein [Cypionkella sp.]